MEHNTDRILWTVLILAIGVALYVSFRPAANGVLHQGIDKIQDVMTDVKSNPSDSSSDSSGTVDSSSNSDFIYSDPDTKDDTISITEYNGKSANLTIPTYRKIGSVDYKVTAIGNNALGANSILEQVTIPDSVQTIGESAFDCDSNLKQVTLGSNVTEIGKWAFQWTALTSVDIPDSVKSIDSDAFYGCYYLKQLRLGSGVTSIGDWAFADTQLSAMSFKSPVALGKYSFTNTQLTNVTLPTGSTYRTDANNQTFDANVKVTFN